MRGFPWAAGKCPFLKLQVRMAEGGVTPCCSDLQAALALGSRPLCILYLVSPSPEHPRTRSRWQRPPSLWHRCERRRTRR